jgi:hypothetical protein
MKPWFSPSKIDGSPVVQNSPKSWNLPDLPGPSAWVPLSPQLLPVLWASAAAKRLTCQVFQWPRCRSGCPWDLAATTNTFQDPGGVAPLGNGALSEPSPASESLDPHIDCAWRPLEMGQIQNLQELATSQQQKDLIGKINFHSYWTILIIKHTQPSIDLTNLEGS